jgi:hypothetical protein
MFMKVLWFEVIKHIETPVHNSPLKYDTYIYSESPGYGLKVSHDATVPSLQSDSELSNFTLDNFLYFLPYMLLKP